PALVLRRDHRPPQPARAAAARRPGDPHAGRAAGPVRGPRGHRRPAGPGRATRVAVPRADVTPIDSVISGAMLAQPLPTMTDWDGTARRYAGFFVAGLRPGAGFAPGGAGRGWGAIGGGGG